jgi:hypothetical protein
MEDFQVSSLKRADADASLRKVAAALGSGGLFMSTLLHGLETILNEAPDISGEVDLQVKQYRSWLTGAEQRLHEAENRGRVRKNAAHQRIESIDEGVEVSVEVNSSGDDIAMSTQVASRERLEAAFVSVTGPAGDSPFSRATVLSPTNALSGVELAGNFRQVSIASVHDEAITGMDLQVVKIPTMGRGVGLLSINEVAECLEIEFHYLSNNEIKSERTGRDVRLGAIDRWTRDELSAVAGLVTQKSAYVDRIRAFGMELMRKTLTDAGQNYVASLYKLIHTLVIFSNQHAIPWEWLCPAPSREGRLLPIADQWRIIRWPSSLIRGVLSLAIAEHDAPGYPLKTVGLPTGETWRAPLPRSAPDLEAAAAEGVTLHLVGHWNGSALKLGDSFALDPLLAKSIMFNKTRNVILSSCDTASVETQSNLAVAISMTSECVVWAPLVALRSDQVDELDRVLCEFLRENHAHTVDEFMRTFRETLPILNVYVRYGLNMWR